MRGIKCNVYDYIKAEEVYIRINGNGYKILAVILFRDINEF